MNSSDSSSNRTEFINSDRPPLNPLLLTSSSENIPISTENCEETFCSKFEFGETRNRKISSDLFSGAPSSNLDDLIKTLAHKVSNVCVDENRKNEDLEKSEVVSTAYQRPSDLFSSPGLFAQDIESDKEVISLSSDHDTADESDSEEEVIEVSSCSDDDLEYERVEARINFMTSAVESRVSSASTLGRKSRMERFLKDVSENLKTLSLEDDFKVKKMIVNENSMTDICGEIFLNSELSFSNYFFF